MTDPEFDNLLKTIRVDVPLPPKFHHEVWQRIETAENGRWTSLIAAFVGPWSAVASIAAMVTLGLWLGAMTTPNAKTSQLTYAESISPFAQTHEK
jgi:hypothetical protein